MKKIYFVLLLFLSSHFLFGQQWDWIKNSGGVASSNEFGDGVKTDNAGNVYVVYRFGISGNNHYDAFFDNDTINLWKYREMYLAKYDSTGNRLWARPLTRYNDSLPSISNGALEPTEMEIDNNGFLYIAGAATVHNMIFGTDTISVDNNITSSFVMKCDTAANPVWFRLSRTILPSNPNLLTTTYAHDVRLDASGNVLITGEFRDSVIFGNDTIINSITNNNASNGFIAKYDNNGNCLWAKAVTGTSSITGLGICSDDSDNVFVGGYAGVPATFENTTLPRGGLLYKIAPSGNLIWSKAFGYRVEDVEFDSTLYVVGDFNDSMIVDNVTYYGTGIFTGFISQLSNSGSVNWLSTLEGSNSVEFIRASFFNRNIYIGGYFRGYIPYSNTNLNPIGSLDVLVAKYSSSGQLKWLTSGGSPGSEQYMHITTDNAGRIYTCGAIEAPLNYFGILSAPIRGNSDAFVARILDLPHYCGLLPLNTSIPGYVCRGDSVLLSAPSGLSSYLWSNGNTDSSFYATDDGTFIYIAYDSTGCFYQGNSYTVDFRPDFQIYTTPNDSIICFGSNATISAISTNSTSNTRLWSTGATTTSITISTPGQYWVTVTNAQSGCVTTDTINMMQAGATCSFNAPACAYDTLFLLPSIQLYSDSITDIYWIVGGTDTIHNDTLNYPFSVFGSRTVKLVVKTLLGCPYSITHTVIFSPTVQITISGDTLFASLSSVNQWLLNGTPIPGANGSYYVPSQTGNYSVINTYLSQCSDTSAVFYFNPAWISEASSSSLIAVSPNPGNGIFTLNFSSDSENFSELIIFNALGEEVFRKNIQFENNRSAFLVNISDQPSGFYSLRMLKSDGESESFRLIIIK